MYHNTHTASGREIHPSINPAPAGCGRALRGSRDPGAASHPDASGERDVFLARARAVVARTRLLWD